MNFVSSVFFDNSNNTMSAHDIRNNLERLNEELRLRGVIGEICLVGGAVMCLVFKARESTHDIDAIFEPKTIIYECIQSVASTYNLPKDWLNDGVKGFLSEHSTFNTYYNFSNLCVRVATAEYLLAMKCLSARMDNENERNDICFLIKHLALKSYEDIENIILKYYPVNRFQAKTRYAIMEVLDGIIEK